MIKISIIIPAYNCEKTIQRCLESITYQTYPNLQVIVINDGSVDNTETIVNCMADYEDRIIIVSIPNGGVSHARNIGLDIAEGDYITFVDADDYIDSEMYESLVNLIQEYCVQIVHCSYRNVDDAGNIINKVGDSGKIILQNHDEAIECLLSDKLYIESLWNKLYYKGLFSNIRLNETISFYEDVLANFMLFDQAEQSVFLDRSYYSYVSNKQSATHTKKGYLGTEQSLYVARQICQLSEGKLYERFAKSKLALKILTLYKDYIYYKDQNTCLKRKSLRKELKQYKKYLYRRNDKIAYYLALYCPPLYKIVFNCYEKKRIKILDPIQ